MGASTSTPSTYDTTSYERFMNRGAGNSLQIVLKVAERCNIACKYCYFFFGGDESYKENPAVISDQTSEAFAAFVRDAVKRYNMDLVRIIIHGGEPLMMKRSRMQRLFELLEEATIGATLQLTIQTNAMLVNSEWIDLFEKFNVYVGVSLDGPEHVNDVNRIDKRQRGTYQRTRAGIDLLFEAFEHSRIARPGLLCVMNPDLATAGELYHHFVDELGFRNIDFLLPDDNHDSVDPERPARFVTFMDALLDTYSREGRPDVQIRFFEKFMNSLTMAPYFSAVLHRFYSQKDVVITVSSAGEIAPDDILRASDASLMKLNLNVGSATLTDVLLSPGMALLNDALFTLPTGCNGCDWANVCRGGDLYHRYKRGSGFDNPSIYCEALRRVQERLATIMLRGGASVQMLERRLATVSNAYV